MCFDMRLGLRFAGWFRGTQKALRWLLTRAMLGRIAGGESCCARMLRRIEAALCGGGGCGGGRPPEELEPGEESETELEEWGPPRTLSAALPTPQEIAAMWDWPPPDDDYGIDRRWKEPAAISMGGDAAVLMPHASSNE